MRSSRAQVRWMLWMPLLALILLLPACDRGTQPAQGRGDTDASSAPSTSAALEAIRQRRLHREQLAAWQRLPEAQRASVRESAALFAALPADEQARLRAEFAQLDGLDQRGWLLGPDIGAAWPKLQPLLSQVPEDQREPLLRILNEMPPAQLQELQRIAWRTPPEERDALRTAFIATTPANRMAWLYQQSQR